jgi:CheY-like chemotaxis protein
MQLMLTKMGHEVTVARNGKEVVSQCAQQLPDLVVTDLVMPEREGLETIEILRRQWPQVRIIAVSGGGRMNAGDLLRVAKLMGARQVLAKPFSHQELELAVAAALR